MENKISLSDLLSNLNSKNGNSEQKFATMVQNDRNKKVQAVSKK